MDLYTHDWRQWAAEEKGGNCSLDICAGEPRAVVSSAFLRLLNTEMAFRAAFCIQRWWQRTRPFPLAREGNCGPVLGFAALSDKQAAALERARAQLASDPAMRYKTYVVRGKRVSTEMILVWARTLMSTWIHNHVSSSCRHNVEDVRFWEFVAHRPRKEYEDARSPSIVRLCESEAIMLLSGVAAKDRTKLAEGRLDEGCITWEGTMSKHRVPRPEIARSKTDRTYVPEFVWCDVADCEQSTSVGAKQPCCHRHHNQTLVELYRAYWPSRFENNTTRGDDLAPQAIEWMLKRHAPFKTNVQHVARPDWASIPKGHKLRRRIGVIPLLLHAYMPEGCQMLDKGRWTYVHTCGNVACVNPKHIKICAVLKKRKRETT